MSESDTGNVEQRLVRIESALAHLQHDLEELNASLTMHFGRMQGFEARFTRIEHELESMSEEGDVRDPEDEKPPHY
jgi:SlyX protein